MAIGSATIPYNVKASSVPQAGLVLLGRFFYALIFLMAAANHFSKQTITYAATQGVPRPSPCHYQES